MILPYSRGVGIPGRGVRVPDPASTAPLGRDHRSRRACPEAGSKGDGRDRMAVEDRARTKSATRRVEPARGAGARPDRILWVDDEADLLKPHLMLLRDEGYVVDAIMNGNDALELLRTESYDLVLLDEQMPGLRGIEVLKETRALEVSAAGLHLEDANGSPSIRPFDALVVGGPRISENSLTRDLSFACDELYTVGDAVLPRNICDAIHEGYKTGVRI